MKNTGLNFIKYTNEYNFTSNIGIRIRKLINPLLRKCLVFGVKRKIHIESYPELEKNRPYIFVSTHSFDEDAITALITIDRNAYMLVGTTDQLEHNPQMYAAWINGIIYVDRQNQDSRKESIKKMERILKSGSSILLFPEGGWNNTENLLIQPLFSGAWILARDTGCQVVPVASFNEHNSKDIWVRVGEPVTVQNEDKKLSLESIRDSMAALVWNIMEEHTRIYKRDTFTGDIRQKFMEERRQEYLKVKWSRDVWDEELTFYHDKEHPRPVKILESLSRINPTRENAYVTAPILARLKSEQKYDFLRYMKDSWKNSI